MKSQLHSNILFVFTEVLKTLEHHHIPYMIVGSVASMIYGDPRLTHDMDLVVDPLPEHAKQIEKFFPSQEFYCPPEEVIQSETVHRGQFNLIHHNTGIKIDFMIRKKSPHSIEEFSRKKKVSFIDELEFFVASPEDVIIKKLLFFKEGGSEKHMRDIRGILSETPVDKDYLQKWIKELGLEKEFQKI